MGLSISLQSSANEAHRLHYELSRFQVSSWLSFRHYCWFEFYNIKYFSIYYCNLSRIFIQWVQVYGWTELKMFFSEEPICVAWIYLVCYRYSCEIIRQAIINCLSMGKCIYSIPCLNLQLTLFSLVFLGEISMWH